MLCAESPNTLEILSLHKQYTKSGRISEEKKEKKSCLCEKCIFPTYTLTLSNYYFKNPYGDNELVAQHFKISMISYLLVII